MRTSLRGHPTTGILTRRKGESMKSKELIIPKSRMENHISITFHVNLIANLHAAYLIRNQHYSIL